MGIKCKALVFLIIAVYVVSPVIFKYSRFIQRNLLFMNHVNYQYRYNLSHPEQLDIKCTRLLRLKNFNDAQLPTPSGELKIELGAWHILPETSLAEKCSHDEAANRSSFSQDAKLAFADSRPIVLYVHGNGGTRANLHRSGMYRRLAYEFSFHIVTFDYRGYGDSTYLEPTTDGLAADARFMYKWLLGQPEVNKDRVIVWGHSLGTAVAVRMVADLPASLRPSRLVLEAPFDSLANAIANHPFSLPFRIIPFFEHFFVEPVRKSRELNFDSASRIGDIKETPILILHAEDDEIIPMKLGASLYKTAVEKLQDSSSHQVKFITIGAQHKLGHKHIYSHNETMLKVNDWIMS